MKRTYSIILVLGITFFITPSMAKSQGTEISITTISDEARETFVIGRQKKENLQRETAEILFNRALELDPKFALAYIYRGKPGDHEKALELIDEVSAGEKLVIKYFKAFDYYEFREAKEYLSQLLEKYPSSKHVHLWAGLFYENVMQNPQLALDHFYIASKLDETYAAPHNEIGYRHMRLGNIEKAEEAFKKYIDLAPECPNAFDSYANFLMKLKRYHESIKQYSEVYDLNPDKTVTIARIGQNYAFLGEYDEAREYYKKYYNISDNVGQKAISLSLSSATYLAEGKIKDATKEIGEYIKLGEKSGINSEIIIGTSYLGLINLEMGNPKEGLKRYLEATHQLETLEIPGPTKNRYTITSLCWLSRAYAINGDFKKADAYLQDALKIVEETNNPLYRNEYYSSKGYVEIEKHNYKEAIENLLLCNQDDPYNIYILAKAYSLGGEGESAQELIEVLDSWENFGIEYIISRLKANELIED